MSNEAFMFLDWGFEKTGRAVEDVFDLFHRNIPSAIYVKELPCKEIVVEFKYGDIYFRYMGATFDWARLFRLICQVEERNKLIIEDSESQRRWM